MSRALEWVSRIFAVTIVMVIPGLVGFWLDERLGTSFLGIVGFVLGISAGMFYLIAITRTPPAAGGDANRRDAPRD